MLIDVTKNETTGKYEVETDVKPTPTPGGGTIAYAWDYHESTSGTTGTTYYNFDIAPEDSTEFNSFSRIIEFYSEGVYIHKNEVQQNQVYVKNSSSVFEINGLNGNPPHVTFTRNPSKDFDFMEYEPGNSNS